MDTQEIVDILSKKSLSPSQISLLKCIRDAGPVGISREDLANKMRDGNIRSMNGVFLALSRRINKSNDTSCPEFFNYYEPRYCMRPALWDAIQQLPGLHAVIEDMTVGDIYDEYDKRSEWFEPDPDSELQPA